MPMQLQGPGPIILDKILCAARAKKDLKATLRAWHLGAFCAFANRRKFLRKDQQGELVDREARRLVSHLLKSERLWKQNREILEFFP